MDKCQKHDCRPIVDRFSKQFHCLFCGKQFISYDEHIEGLKTLYIDLYGMILDENNPLLSTESVLVIIDHKLEKLGHLNNVKK
jgi:hypothetical protein